MIWLSKIASEKWLIRHSRNKKTNQLYIYNDFLCLYKMRKRVLEIEREREIENIVFPQIITWLVGFSAAHIAVPFFKSCSLYDRFFHRLYILSIWQWQIRCKTFTHFSHLLFRWSPAHLQEVLISSPIFHKTNFFHNKRKT